MGVYTGANNWVPQIYQFEETDVVLGGPNGIDNVPLKNLADRTIFLYNKIGLAQNFDGYRDISHGYNIAPANAGQLQCAFAAGVSDITLNDASDFKPGTIIPIAAYCNDQSVIRLIPSNGQQFYFLDGQEPILYMHNNESILLIALNGHFKVLNASGNFKCAGEEIKSRKVLNNTLPFVGQELQRALYPRLWKFITTLNFGQEVTNEATYFSDAVTYRGLFTTGNGTTTFRLPDERGMFDRMLDRINGVSRGLDNARGHNYPGGYQADAMAYHAHTFKDRYYSGSAGELANAGTKESQPTGYNNRIGSNATDSDNTQFAYINAGTDYVGEGENRPKNIGKINLIKF